MEKMIACCGVECTKCLAFIATKENNDGLRKKQAEEWSKQFNQTITPESINCDGCLSTGRHVNYLRMRSILCARYLKWGLMVYPKQKKIWMQ